MPTRFLTAAPSLLRSTEFTDNLVSLLVPVLHYMCTIFYLLF
jgi:hypothetical protein